ncbi:hypothetical protein DKX38_011760 [Salix brachista]|uniref:Uncharacterized protein n=1 Tax=Salix brachista TaxID=2182728 RepID=A0A5N5LZI1_9ROSI|nr:hypothetical protein DKX38_011760 [Salix brachista]
MDRPGHGLVPMVLRLHAGQPSPAFRTSLRKRIRRATFFSRKTATSIVEVCFAELKRLGKSYSSSLQAINRLMIARCDHEQMKNAEGCIVEIIGENNLDHFFVGTQDTDIRKKFQEIDWHGIEIFESWLKVILNSDGEIENMDEETHAERHARTVALAQPNGRLRFKPVSKSVNASSKDCSKMVILHANNDNKTQIFFKAAIARLEALENDYTRIETVEAVDDDEASLEDDVYIQKKQKDTKHKTRQVKALENARKAPRNFL